MNNVLEFLSKIDYNLSEEDQRVFESLTEEDKAEILSLLEKRIFLSYCTAYESSN